MIIGPFQEHCADETLTGLVTIGCYGAIEVIGARDVRIENLSISEDLPEGQLAILGAGVAGWDAGFTLIGCRITQTRVGVAGIDIDARVVDSEIDLDNVPDFFDNNFAFWLAASRISIQGGSLSGGLAKWVLFEGTRLNIVDTHIAAEPDDPRRGPIAPDCVAQLVYRARTGCGA